MSQHLPLFPGSAPAMSELGNEDDEAVEYKQALWTAIIEAYCGVLNGYCADKLGNINPAAVAVVAPNLHHILQFAQKVVTDEYVKEVMNKEVLGLIGDLAKHMGKPYMAQYVAPMQPWLTPYLSEALRDEDAKDNAQYAQAELQKLLV